MRVHNFEEPHKSSERTYLLIHLVTGRFFCCVPKKFCSCFFNMSSTKMILWGRGTLSTDSAAECTDQVVLSIIAQLLRFHVIKRKWKQGTSKHHGWYKVTPVPVYMAMKLYGETRKKKLVDTAFKLGLSISHDRLKSITNELANQVCKTYPEENVACPPSLRNGVFATASADNLDYNPSSTRQKELFTARQFLSCKHPTTEDEGTSRKKLSIIDEMRGKRNAKNLPAEYTVVPPVFLQYL